MRIITWCLFILILVSNFKASASDFSGSLNAGYNEKKPYGGKFYTGLSLNFEFDSNWGIHYTFLIGNKYFHMPLSPIIGVVAGGLSFEIYSWDTIGTDKNLIASLAIAILVSIIPETVSYKIPISKIVEFTPYVSPLQLDCYTFNGSTSFYPMIAFGSKFHFNLNKIKARISPYIEYKFQYGHFFNQSFSSGLELTYNFDFSKKE